MITRNKYKKVVKSIQKRVRNNIKNRYSFLRNNNNVDPITLNPICMIPRKGLYIHFEQNKYLYGCDAVSLLTWISSCDFFTFPKNPITNKYMSIGEMKRCIKNVKTFATADKLISDTEKKEIIKCIQNAESLVKDYLEPERVYIRLGHQRETYINQLESIIDNHSEFRYICICTLINCEQLTFLQCSDDLKKKIQELARKIHDINRQRVFIIKYYAVPIIIPQIVS